jgi:iron complex transport system substrate-binding protein
MLKKITKITILMLLPILMLCGCLKTAKNEPPNNHNNNVAFPLEVTDFVDRVVTIEKEPQRIVSLSPATTEILFALGVGERIVGITTYDDYPPEQIKSLRRVGDFQGPNIEAILAQNPDIIFGSRLSGQEQMEALAKAGFPVVILEAASFSQITDSIALTAQITNTKAEGTKIIRKMQNKIATIQQKVKDLPKSKTFYLVDANGNWTAGKDTFIDELITLGGGENIAGELNGWIQFSLETLLQKNPVVILTAPHAGSMRELFNSPGFQDMEAVKKRQIFVISDDNIISRPSYRIVQGLEEIAKFLHPEAFSEAFSEAFQESRVD